MKYNVLWIDDDSLKENFKVSEEFLQEAELIGINIDAVDNYDDGIKWLKQNKATCDAVILDVNCLKQKNSPEDPSMDVFTDNIHNIRLICETNERIIPWFVYTGGGYKGAEALKTSIPIPDWRDENDTKRYFSKPTESEILFDTIKSYVDKYGILPLKMKYKKELEICPEYANTILKIANNINNSEMDSTPLNELRDIMEWIKEYAKNHGVFSDKVITLSNASSFIRLINNVKYVPEYIKYVFQAANNLVQDGSHSKNAGADEKKKPIVKEYVRNGIAKRLIETIFHNVMMLLEWCTYLPNEEKEIQDIRKITDAIKLNYDDITGIVKKDYKTYYCEDDEGQKCVLDYKIIKDQGIELEEHIGKFVTAIEVVDNRHNKERYPYYARKLKL